MGQQDDYRNLGPQEKWMKGERGGRFMLVRINNKE